MKKTFAAVSLSALLFIVLAGAFFIRVGFANPSLLWENWGLVNPTSDTVPPQITIISPKNNTCHYNRTIELTFNVNKPIAHTARLLEVSYKPSWISQRVYLVNIYEGGAPDDFSGSLLLEVPDSKQSIEIYAKYVVYYRYPEQRAFARSYITGSSTVMFTVDTTPPRVSVLSPQNQTYESPDVPLIFTVNRQTTWMGYSLDGQDKIAIKENTTLLGMPEGCHTLKVYVEDIYGFTGASGTVTFTVDTSEQFPTTIVAVSVLPAAIACTGALTYFKKRKQRLEAKQ